MTPWQEGFVKQCEARKVDPRAVAKFAAEYARGQEAAKQQLAKRAEAAKKAFDSMTPYQQGFAVRCHQRGIPAEKVASFVMKKKAQEVPNSSMLDISSAIDAANDAELNAQAASAIMAGQEEDRRRQNREAGSAPDPDRFTESFPAQEIPEATAVDKLKAALSTAAYNVKQKGKEGVDKVKNYVKTPTGKAVAGGGAALTAALLAAYLLSRKKKKAKK